MSLFNYNNQEVLFGATDKRLISSPSFTFNDTTSTLSLIDGSFSQTGGQVSYTNIGGGFFNYTGYVGGATINLTNDTNLANISPGDTVTINGPDSGFAPGDYVVASINLAGNQFDVSGVFDIGFNFMLGTQTVDFTSGSPISFESSATLKLTNYTGANTFATQGTTYSYSLAGFATDGAVANLPVADIYSELGGVMMTDNDKGFHLGGALIEDANITMPDNIQFSVEGNSSATNDVLTLSMRSGTQGSFEIRNFDNSTGNTVTFSSLDDSGFAFKKTGTTFIEISDNPLKPGLEIHGDQGIQIHMTKGGEQGKFPMTQDADDLLQYSIYTLPFNLPTANGQVITVNMDGTSDFISLASAVDTVTAVTSPLTEDKTVLRAGSNAVDLQPDPTTMEVGRSYTVTVADITNSCSVTPTSGTINGAASFTFTAVFESITMWSDGGDIYFQ